METPKNILGERLHPAMRERAAQLRLNWLAIHGGRDYVDARLWRHPNESNASWLGQPADGHEWSGGVGCVGRKERARCPNDAGRISAKIEQYIFSRPVNRAGISPEFEADVTGGGENIERFFAEVCEAITAHGWAWLQVDRAAAYVDQITGEVRPRTIAERERDGDRPIWKLWRAPSVPDWDFDEWGRVNWLIAEEISVRCPDPSVAPVQIKVRTAWRRGVDGAGATWERWTTGKESACIESGAISSPEIPFVLVGKPSPHSWWFDDVEAIQAQLLNLDSLHYENLSREVFPQLVVPDSVVSGLEARIVQEHGQQGSEQVLNLVREVLRGAEHPLVETAETSGISRYIQPSAGDLLAIPNEADRKRAALFDSVGMALFNRETRQVATAESKAWDFLDTAATLRNRSRILQLAEAALVARTVELDPSFAEYEPIWPLKFDVVDVASATDALTKLANVELVPHQRAILLKAATRILRELGDVSPDDEKTISAEIEENEKAPAVELPPVAVPAQAD